MKGYILILALEMAIIAVCSARNHEHFYPNKVSRHDIPTKEVIL